MEPNDDIQANFGTGIILAGLYEGNLREFFILEEDRNKLRWGHVIANYLLKLKEEEEESWSQMPPKES